MSIILDLIILAIVIFNILTTYRRGFVKSVLDFASSILSIVFANIFSPYVSDMILPILTEQLTHTDKTIPETALSLFAHALAFATLFAVFSIVFKVATLFVSGIFKLPLLNGLNKTLGIILGCVKALISLFIFVGLMQLIIPLATNTGSALFSDEIVQSTFIFKYLYNIKWINFLVK